MSILKYEMINNNSTTRWIIQLNNKMNNTTQQQNAWQNKPIYLHHDSSSEHLHCTLSDPVKVCFLNYPLYKFEFSKLIINTNLLLKRSKIRRPIYEIATTTHLPEQQLSLLLIHKIRSVFQQQEQPTLLIIPQLHHD